MEKPLKDRAQYVKNVSENTEKWFDPKTGKTFLIYVETTRDFDHPLFI
jgi:hypothetical protein